MSLERKFVRAIAFCLDQDDYGGDAKASARWVLTGEGDEPPSDARVALVFGGATKIKDYVFESARLPEIRGASGLLDRVNTVDVRHLWEQPEPDGVGCEECIIYASGGEVLAFAPLCRAQWLADEIERCYARETMVAQSVAVWQAFELNQIRRGLLAGANFDRAGVERLLGYVPTSEGGFGSLIIPLALARYRRREGNAEAGRAGRVLAHVETVPFARRCSSCERRAAVVNARVGDQDRPLCEPCARKRVFGQLAKKEKADIEWFRKFRWQPDAKGQADAEGRAFQSWMTKFEAALTKYSELGSQYLAGTSVGNVREPDAARDLNEIGQASSPRGFVGFVYADGNDMGRLLQSLDTPSDYATFAKGVSDALQEATFAALAKHLSPAWVEREKHPEKVLIHPFEILGIGGDDLILIVPAHVAVQLACEIAGGVERRLLETDATFELPQKDGPAWAEVQRCRGKAEDPQRKDEAPQCKVSLSAGVVIADAHTPIFYLEQLADQLLKSAKRRAKLLRQRRYFGGTLDFISLKSVTTLSGTVEQFRRSALTDGEPRRGERHRYARPYTLAEARALVKTIEILKRADFPRGHLYRLNESLRDGEIPSTVDYRYFLSRDGKLAAARKEIEEMWPPTGAAPQASPWRERLRPRGESEPGVKLETIWPDVAELYDFVPGGEEEYAGA